MTITRTVQMNIHATILEAHGGGVRLTYLYIESMLVAVSRNASSCQFSYRGNVKYLQLCCIHCKSTGHLRRSAGVRSFCGLLRRVSTTPIPCRISRKTLRNRNRSLPKYGTYTPRESKTASCAWQRMCRSCEIHRLWLFSSGQRPQTWPLTWFFTLVSAVHIHRQNVRTDDSAGRLYLHESATRELRRLL